MAYSNCNPSSLSFDKTNLRALIAGTSQPSVNISINMLPAVYTFRAIAKRYLLTPIIHVSLYFAPTEVVMTINMFFTNIKANFLLEYNLWTFELN